MCMIDDAEPVLLLRDIEHTARKLHCCSECGRIIIPGETYRCEVYIFEGERKTHKTRPHCQVLRAWLQDECSGMVYGSVVEDYLEHVHDGRRFDVLRVGAMAQRRWMRPGRGLYPVPPVPKTTHERILDLGPPKPSRRNPYYDY